jgi:glycosidase
MKHPLLYEINARQWMAALRAQHGPAMDLASVPSSEFARLASLGFTHLWLMGVWPTGQRSREQAVEHSGLRSAYDEALPGWTESDIEGSPYAVEAWEVSERLGGREALAIFRRRLAESGMGLILDFVPNHLGLDHRWLKESTSRFVAHAEQFPFSFALGEGAARRFVAHGKDPYFDGWTDTVQLEYRRKETRIAMVEQLKSVAAQCDGVRCDMAMLLLSEIFNRTWAHVPLIGESAVGEFWSEAIDQVRQDRPDFLFLAEAYWDLEGALCSLGFDYAYDKKLYDLLVHDHVGQVQSHLLGMGEHNARRAHFLENHDEPRVSGLLDAERHRAALTLSMGLPGMRFVHDGQMEGRRRFARVQLSRWAQEVPDSAVNSMYQEVLKAFSQSSVGRGVGSVLPTHRAWADNPTSECLTVIDWASGPAEKGRDLVVVNLAPHRAQGRIYPTWQGVEHGTWRLRDRLGSEVWWRDGAEIREQGLYLDLPARGAQLFEVEWSGQ